MPDELWDKIKGLFPQPPDKRGPGRPQADSRAALNGIWYVLWTGCQWKAVHRDWFGVCSSTLHERFQTWQQEGIFHAIMVTMVGFYNERKGIEWEWQSLDSKSCPAPLGGEKTGKNPTDRAKSGGKIHILVDARGAPLALHITGANEHDKWSADDLIFSMVIERPDSDEIEQHLCADRGYDYDDVHQVLEQVHYVSHIKHRRRRMNPKATSAPSPANCAILLDVGLLNALSAGLPNGVASAFDGLRSLKTGWLLFNLPLLISCSILHFTDRFLVLTERARHRRAPTQTFKSSAQMVY